ncbi:MAG: cytochrome P450, partial [Rikenellaceae bacterium]|nr:cytochrome P450 [Rikenellaceae bacterium]
MNRINHISLDLRTDSEGFARELFSRWDGFYDVAVELPAARVLDSVSTDERVTVERVEIDLGVVDRERFYGVFAERFREALTGELHRILKSAGPQVCVTAVGAPESAFDILCGFLLNGYLSPGGTDKYGKDPDALFLFVLENHGEEFVRFLRTYGHYTSLQRRMVYQFDDGTLEAGVRKVVPSEAGFICSYVRLLREKTTLREAPVMRGEDHRNVVWSVVYSYLLDDWGSYFNRKGFICRTISALSGRFNVTFGHLVRIVTDNIGGYTDVRTDIPELIRLLSEIRRDTESAENRKLLADRDKLFKMLYSGLRRNDFPPDYPYMPVLRALLADGESCRRFVRPLREAETERLARAVSPRGGDFIVGYSRELDRQNTTGALQGHTSGDFRTVKWAIMLPLLVSGTGQGFNRKWYVRRVLGRVAAHYNLYVADILSVMTDAAEGVPAADRELAAIIGELWAACRPAAPGPVAYDGAIPDEVRAVVRSGDMPGNTFRKELTLRLRDCRFRKALAGELTCEEITLFAALWFRPMAEIGSLLEIAFSLPELQGGGSAGGTAAQRHVKEAVLELLADYGGGRADRTELVVRLAELLSACSGVGYGELLSFFRLRSPVGFGRELETLWDGWYRYRPAVSPVGDMAGSLRASGMAALARNLTEAMRWAADLYPVIAGKGINMDKGRFERMVGEWLVNMVCTSGTGPSGYTTLMAGVKKRLSAMTGIPERDFSAVSTTGEITRAEWDSRQETAERGIKNASEGRKEIPVVSDGRTVSG